MSVATAFFMQSIYAASAHIFVKRKKNSLGKSFDFGVDPLAVFIVCKSKYDGQYFCEYKLYERESKHPF